MHEDAVAWTLIPERSSFILPVGYLRVVMTETNFSKLHLFQNTIAHIITGTKRYDHVKKEVTHITSVLAKLHWLPVQ